MIYRLAFEGAISTVLGWADVARGFHHNIFLLFTFIIYFFYVLFPLSLRHGRDGWFDLEEGIYCTMQTFLTPTQSNIKANCSVRYSGDRFPL